MNKDFKILEFKNYFLKKFKINKRKIFKYFLGKAIGMLLNCIKKYYEYIPYKNHFKPSCSFRNLDNVDQFCT
ncbi:hypothetical protein EGI22_13855 [Lacihabitans sp. LS3-19]|nr:hypothetical protein [Lacihabitans sp. LS3-19]